MCYNKFIKSKEEAAMKKYWFEDLMMSDLMEKGMLVLAHVALVAGVICLILKVVGA